MSRCEHLERCPRVCCLNKVRPVVEFEPFITEGLIGVNKGVKREIVIIRDTGANLSLVLRDTVEWDDSTFTGEEVDVAGIGTSSVVIPIHYVWLKSGFVSGRVKVRVSEKLPISGVDTLLRIDLPGNMVVPSPELVENPMSEKGSSILQPEINEYKEKVEESVIYPACVVTRTEAMRMEKVEESEMGLCPLFEGMECNNEVKSVKSSGADGETEIVSDFVVEKKNNKCTDGG